MRFRIHAAIVAALLACTATACAGTDEEVTTKPKAPAAADTGAEKKDDGAKAEAAKKQQDAKVGDTIALKGLEAGHELDVTVVKVVDNAKPADEFFAPEDGNRWLGVQFQLVNTGSKAYSDAPMNGAKLVDDQGQQFQVVLGDISAGPSMQADVNLKPGSKALGWITFELPKKSKAATVQFGMDSGFSDQTGEWKLS
ncbi:DUF4352 domain-containing protein [Streptomyces acidicola]|uniref:DUF4352 domain-containing protein n=1 Tax=Streptomyces acidicola TaxID=2596892 RepID=A0A5N8WJ62_9ACTN|nr:DUF4352 domain-containing protein [Streptomyces acidicola]MPY47142.1 DUF4352 domain-containing protein [Streptomyces acidicola]MPY47281.1 DUF4352 domain-containing protein [Streptomyces acidicola]